LLHGLIHLMGFAKAFNLGNVTQLSKEITKPLGWLWLIVACLFVVTTILLLLKNGSWFILGIIAAIISQFLIITVWKDAKFGTIANVLVLFACIPSWGAHHFEMQFQADVKNYLQKTNALPLEMLQASDIIELPLPVQKYIRYVGALGKPKLKNVRIVFEGEMREKGKDWFTFSTIQYNFFDEPTRLFFMKAKMFGTIVPGYHCYQNKMASMQIKLLGLFNIVNAKGDIMNKAETVTVFNDMCLMAPASLIDKRIEWTPIDSLSAKATFTNGPNRITATLFFNENGQLVNFISDDRYAIADMKQYRFSTPIKDYKRINGMQVLSYGEAIWHYPDGAFVYGKFNLKSIEYNVTEMRP
jgi:hypothetical protein